MKKISLCFLFVILFPLFSFSQIYLYEEDFENNDGGWVVSGVNTSWEWGIPGTSDMNTAASGDKAWVTNLTGGFSFGDYNSNELSYLTSPTFNFSGQTADPYIGMNIFKQIERDYDECWMEVSINGGGTWTKVLGSTGAKNWYNNITNQCWDGSNSPSTWANVFNQLTGTSGQSNVKIRFVFDSDSSIERDGFALDNLYIIESGSTDLKISKQIEPVSDDYCGTPLRYVRIEVINRGTTTIDSIDISYQIDGGTIVTETKSGLNLSPNSSALLNFNQFVSLTNVGSNKFLIWGKAIGDGFSLNDTIKTIYNANNTYLPYMEGFEEFPLGVNTINGWTKFPDDNYNGIDYKWVAHIGPSSSTLSNGPVSGRNGTDSSGVYMFVDGQNSNVSPAYLESPCINLTNVLHAELNFWYHKFGSGIGDLYIDIRHGFSGTRLDTIVGQTHLSSFDPFLKRTINLDQFAGQIIQITFREKRGQQTRSHIAIDDFLVFEVIAEDVKLNELVSPISGCELSSNEDITIQIENEGLNSIDSLYVCYQIGNSAIVCDTIFGLSIQPDSILNYTFSQQANLSNIGDYNLKVWSNCLADSNQFNDTIFKTISNETNVLPAYEAFENFNVSYNADGFINGWSVTPSVTQTEFRWNTNQAGTLSLATGPLADHTSGTSTGKYIYAEASQGNLNDTCLLVSSCYDLRLANTADLSFWYHLYGANMGSMYVDIFDGNQWYLGIDSLIGQQQTTQGSPWLMKIINLDSLVGSFINVRFRGIRGSNWESDISLDDVRVYGNLSTAIEPIGFEIFDLKIYPNPSPGEFTIIVPQSLIGSTFTLVDVQGKEIKSDKMIFNQMNLNYSELVKGIYFLYFLKNGVHKKIVIY